MPGQYIHRKEMYLMGLMSVVAGTTDERDIGNVMKELPVTDEIKNGLLGADGLFGDVFRLESITNTQTGTKWRSLSKNTTLTHNSLRTNMSSALDSCNNSI